MEGIVKLGAHQIVHLDLKRAPLKVDYLEKIFPLFSEWGATGLLIEWEDTFPYFGNLESIGSCNTDSKAYSFNDIERIVQLAEIWQLSIIPLVQTFGHLEFVLRHAEWKHVREDVRFPNALCPSNPKSLDLVTNMIDQVISRMPKSLQYFHIGADEVWQLGSCSFCSSQDKHSVLLDYLVSVLKHLKEHHPCVRPIMWDDMIRGVPSSVIQGTVLAKAMALIVLAFGTSLHSADKLTKYIICVSARSLAELVDIMVWFYEPAPFFNMTNEIWSKYTSIFNKVWIASAFKGATGSCQVLPVIQHHVSNHEQWISHIKKSQTDIIGIALTGWSRYDHFATLCELLPTALPCLAICLNICRTGSFSQENYKKISMGLGYTQVPLLMNPFPRPQVVSPELNFPGWKVCTGVEWLANLKGKHSTIINSDQIGTWMNSWQLEKGFVNPMQIQGILQILFDIEAEWRALELYMNEHMSEVYFRGQIEEWTDTHIKPLRQKAEELWKAGQDIIV